MKKAIEYLETAKKKLSFVDAGIVYTVCEKPFYDACEFINSAIVELKALDRWYTPEQWEQRMGEAYPDEAPVWSVSKYAIREKPTKYNRLHWWLGAYKEAKDNRVVEIILCSYNHLGPPPDDWRPEEN